jgi:hypothetical protein
MKYPSQEYLKSIFTYCKNTGVLTRKIRPIEHFSSKRTFDFYNSKYANTEVSAKNAEGYLIAVINKKIYRAHRVVWIMEFGALDDSLIVDHVNGIIDDNRISNLRVCRHVENMRNMKKKKTDLPLGVYFDKARGSYRASVGLGKLGKVISKRFKNLDDAVLWRDAATKELGYHNLHGKKQGA